MNSREQVTAAWAETCRLADSAGPTGYRHVIEHALHTAMQKARATELRCQNELAIANAKATAAAANQIPDLPAPAKGHRWVSFEFSLLGGQLVEVEYCPEDDSTNRVFINGADISELFADVRADVSMKLDQQAYDAYCKQCQEARAA